MLGPTVSGDMQITTGSGQDDIFVGPPHVVNDTIISTGSGDDILSIFGGTYDDRFKVSLGRGEDSFSSDLSLSIPRGPLTFGGPFILDTGNQDDVIKLLDGSFASRTVVKAGNGDDTLVAVGNTSPFVRADGQSGEDAANSDIQSANMIGRLRLKNFENL